jgi:hypothetical protein
MFKRNQITTGLAISAVLLASSATVNAEITNDSATVTVQNAFTLASTTPIDFGVLRVSQTGVHAEATPSRTLLNVDGTQTGVSGDATANGSLTLITAGTPGRIDVTNAAPFTNLTVLLDTTTPLGFNGLTSATAFEGINEVDLTTAGAGANDKFVMFVNETDTRIEGGTSNGVAYTSGTPNLRTDGTGAVGMSFGGTLVYQYDSTTSPADAVYSGNYAITVNY